tara:strand:+ start:881 stop:1453 length:573 start_codon:yes stop_codon:yes gene_type:complete
MAVTNVLLISATTLKNTTTISESVDDANIYPITMLAQDKYILPVLGTDLFEKLKTEVAGTPAGNYLILLRDYVSKCLCWYTYAELLPHLKYRVVNHSVVSMNNEQGTTATFDDLKPLISQAIDMAQFYRERMIDYLSNNSSLFVEFSSNTGADMSPTSRNYYAGINMDKSPPTNRQAQAILSAMGIKNVC